MKTGLSGKLLAAAGAIAAVSAVCVSIYLDPPSAAKARALDEERLQSLQQIDSVIRGYYRNHQSLPERLDVVENKGGLLTQSNWSDPVTHLPYEYEVTGKTTYRLCANFSAASESADTPFVAGFRSHRKGRDCFQEEVDAQ